MTVRVTGLRETVRSLDQLGRDVGNLGQAMTRAGALVATEARTIARKLSGRMAGSITAVGRRASSLIRAGGPGILYAGVQHYGGYHGITPNLFLTDALDHKQRAVTQEISDELNSLIRRRNLI